MLGRNANMLQISDRETIWMVVGSKRNMLLLDLFRAFAFWIFASSALKVF